MLKKWKNWSWIQIRILVRTENVRNVINFPYAEA